MAQAIKLAETLVLMPLKTNSQQLDTNLERAVRAWVKACQ